MNVQISRVSSWLCNLAFSSESESLVGVDAGGNLHRGGVRLFFLSLSPAVGALFFDQRTPTGTLGTCAGQRKKALVKPDLPGPAASRAYFWFGSHLRAISGARFAGEFLFESNLTFDAKGGFLESN